MKKAIFAIAIGEGNPMYRAAIDSFQAYADRVGADLILSRELHYPLTFSDTKYDASPAWSEKMRIGDLLKEYDRVLYLDSDIIVKPTARDVFDEYLEMDTVYMLDEGMIVDRQSAVDAIFKVLPSLPHWEKAEGRCCYYNVGVILISNQCPLFQYANADELQQVCNGIPFYEQTYFNYVIQKHKIKHQTLASNFNRMNIVGFDHYKEADFIHYAGRGYGKNGRKRELGFIKDYCDFFANDLTLIEQKQLSIAGWEFYLERVSKKYRYAPKFILRGLCHLFQK